MTPLQQIALGLLVVVLDSTSTYDTLPDPVGWALVLPALLRLPRSGRTPPLAVGAVAAVVSAVTWFPGPREAVSGLDPSLDWALFLVPDLAFAWLLCRTLARTAADADDLRSAGWVRVTGTLFLLLALAPVPFLATDREVPGDLSVVLQAAWLLLVVLLFAYHRRPWAPRRRSEAGPDQDAGTSVRRRSRG